MTVARRRILQGLAAAAALRPGASWSQGMTEPADLVLLNGRITTLDPGLGEVPALAIRAGRILAAGQPAEVTGPQAMVPPSSTWAGGG